MKLIGWLFNEAGLRALAWASLVSEILIVATGGAVRLTASGLGCPTWPTCTAESIVTVPEMGIHGVIEFANRMLTFVVLLIAFLFLLAAWRSRGSRKILSTAFWLVGGIFMQAVVGGISVITKLNPWIVGLHFIISAGMIAIASIQIWRVYSPEVSAGSTLDRALSRVLISLTSVAMVIGIIVTGSGPHAGDANAPRNGLNSELWQHFHSYPAYLALFSGIILLILVRRRDVDGYSSRLVFWSVFTLLAQAAIGVIQARIGLPVWMVLVHMTLASIVASLMTLQWLSFSKK